MGAWRLTACFRGTEEREGGGGLWWETDIE
jgi:hypothetical protein